MTFVNILKKFLGMYKRIDVKTLPSQGLFYKEDFKLFIEKVSIEDIVEYEHNYMRDNIGIVISRLKKIVEKNTIFSGNYGFNDIKSIDIIFIFLEIVKFTTDKPISIKYFNDELLSEESIDFDSKSFNYFNINENIMSGYDYNSKLFVIDGYKYTLPTIGVENCLTNYLISKSNDPDPSRFNNYNYTFTHFIGNKNTISFPEIDNLIEIFNFDMDIKQKGEIRNIVKTFSPIQKYSLKKGETVIEISSKIDLEKIWK
jgi:hypothetical protein